MSTQNIGWRMVPIDNDEARERANKKVLEDPAHFEIREDGNLWVDVTSDRHYDRIYNWVLYGIGRKP